MYIPHQLLVMNVVTIVLIFLISLLPRPPVADTPLKCIVTVAKASS